MNAPLASSLVGLLLVPSFAAIPEEAPAPKLPAAAPASTERPRVALVLSGGGARGAAHIGVLEVLEELHVPVDYVVGTSMGAIVGGLYCAGLSPAEIRAALSGADWGDLFDDEPARRHLFWRRKLEEQSFLVDLELGVSKQGLELPTAFVQGQKITPLFQKLAARARGEEDFDKLRLPYRAVATDALTGDTVVLARGSLAMAMRASMSIAGVFAPVEHEGRLLVDGAYSDNLPVDAGRALGADLVIAVDLGTRPIQDPDELRSLLAMSMQMTDVLIAAGRRKVRASLRPEDVLLEPELGDFSVADFARTEEAVRIGEQCARTARDRLAPLAVDETAWAAWLARQRAPAAEAPFVRSVQVENQSSFADEVLLARIGSQAGERLDTARVEDDLAELYGFGTFDRVEACLRRDDDGTTGDLIYSAHEKPWGPNYLRFGLRFADDFDGNATYGLGFGLTVAPTGPNGAEWRTDAQLGNRLLFATTYFLPLDAARRWFIEPAAGYERRQLDLEEQGAPDVEAAVERYGGGLSIGRILGEWGEARAGARWQGGEIAVEDDPSSPDDGTFEDAGPTVAFAWDTLDDRDWPSEGTIGVLQGFAALESLGSDEDYGKADLYTGAFVSSGAWTFNGSFEVGTAFGDELPLQEQFLLGGFRRISGIGIDSLAGSEIVLAQLGVYRALGPRKEFASVATYAGVSFELGQVWDDREAIDYGELTPSGAAYLGWDTPLGPLVVGFGMADSGSRTAYLLLGRVY